jgi:branched-chain amino acid transport system ATP-binding protein
VGIWRVEFSVDRGTIVGLIGPNGAGKTTLFNVISGLLKPDTGEIKFEGREITALPPHGICHMGIARTYQLTRPFMQMTPLQNVMVGCLYGGNRTLGMRQAREESERILEFTGLGGKRVRTAAMLGLVDRKKLEIARALATKPKLLLLDEMMAGLNPAEVEEAMHLLKEIKDSGVTLVVVEHVMQAVLGLSDRVVVLSSGKKIAEGTPGDIVHNRDVIEAYLGEEDGDLD